MYAYIVDNKISELFPSDAKPGKCIKMPDDWFITDTHAYKYDPATDTIVVDNNPPPPPAPTQAELDEMDLNSLRGYRNGLLAQSDWMANSDSPEMTDEWKTYRQALRDITKTYKNEREVVWPTPPS
tara:strand:+ start:1448 stop:1825 length:378 start_codon:yes stop_codon:yes gene_type:complete